MSLGTRATSHYQRIQHYTPLRYPGGKTKLAAYIESILESNGLNDGDYVEPYAGGAGVAMELLLNEYVQRIHINDISRPIAAFWNSVVEQTDAFIKLILKTPLTVRAWDRAKHVFSNHQQFDDLELGFATLFLNRTNRSGILNGGMIGGREQSGHWKIDARFNRAGLAARVEAIGRMRRRITITSQDAKEFIESSAEELPRNTLFYLDPPYYRKGKDLYYDYYTQEDHESMAKTVRSQLRGRNWIVSYDDCPETRALYRGSVGLAYQIGYSAREVRDGSEVMFFSSTLIAPEFPGRSAIIKG